MQARNNQDMVDAKPVRLLAAAGSGILLLIVLVALLGKFLAAADQDLINLARQSLAGAFPSSIRSILGEQAQVMGLPLQAGSQAYWYLARAGGIVAYVLLWLATCWGIMMSSKVIKGMVSVPKAYSLHEFLPILGVVFAALHAVVLLGDSYIGFDVWQLVIPFASSYEPFWTGLGTVSFYLFLALVASSYLRKQIGQKLWRVFHYASYLAFLAALLHGIMAGSDSGVLGMRALYLATGGISLFLIYYRMLSYSPRKSRDRTSRSPKRMTENLLRADYPLGKSE